MTATIRPKWYTVREVAQLLGYGLSKTKALIASGRIRSAKDSGNRRVLPGMGGRVHPARGGLPDTAGKARENGEGSIYPYRNGFAAYAWVTLPNGKRQRKYVYGKTRDEVHDKWIKLLNDAKGGAGHHQDPEGRAVPAQLAGGGGQAELLHRATKTEASDDDLPMPPIAATVVRLRRLQRVADRRHADVSWQESGLLFTTRHGTAIEPRNFNRSWDRRCEKAGVPKITVHDGRRSCASLLAELGVHPRVIMRILRHANMKVTMEIYTEVSDEATRKALQQLSESLDI